MILRTNNPSFCLTACIFIIISCCQIGVANDFEPNKQESSILDSWIKGLTTTEDKNPQTENMFDSIFGDLVKEGLKEVCDQADSYLDLNLTLPCVQSLKGIACSFYDWSQTQKLQNLTEIPWFLKVIDAAAKPPASVLDVKLRWVGGYDQCVRIHHTSDKRNFTFDGNYCTLDVSVAGTLDAFVTDENNEENETCHGLPLSIGFCGPKTCSSEDMTILADKYKPPQFCKASVNCQKEPEPMYENCWTILAWLVTVVVFTLCAVATTIDYYWTKVEYETQNKGAQALLAFSLYTNAPKILSLKRSSESLDCLHGIRVLSMAWVIYGHTYYFSMGLLENPIVIFRYPGEFLFQVINNATLSVDSFFVLSGFLVGYVALKRPTCSSDFKRCAFWGMYWLHRYIRLVPVLLFTIIIFTGFYPYLGEGPFYPSTDKGPMGGCEHNWWQTILFINNWGGFGSCIHWTWYLAIDMQFYWFSPVYLILLNRWPKIGITIVLIMIAISSAMRFTTGFILNWKPSMGNTVDFIRTLDDKGMAGWMYQKPYMRCGPWLVGLLAAYFIVRKQRRFQMNKFVAAGLWLFTLFVTNITLFGLYNWARTGHIDRVTSAVYLALNRTSWGVGVAGVILLCLFGYGGPINSFLSWSGWFPLSRLTFCAYILHPIVGMHMLQTRYQNVYATHADLFYLFISLYVITYAASFAFSCMFEAPWIQLEKLVFGRGKKKESSNEADNRGKELSQSPKHSPHDSPRTTSGENLYRA